VAVAPRTGKIFKNGLNVFKRRDIYIDNMLQNGILHFVFRLISQLSEIAFET